MPRPAKLTPHQLVAATGALPGWEIVEGKLHRVFQFKDFVDAWGFMSKVALVAQSMDHHPDWSNVYKTVTVDLNTHDAGGITQLDLDLAGQMSRLAGMGGDP